MGSVAPWRCPGHGQSKVAGLFGLRLVLVRGARLNADGWNPNSYELDLNQPGAVNWLAREGSRREKDNFGWKRRLDLGPGGLQQGPARSRPMKNRVRLLPKCASPRFSLTTAASSGRWPASRPRPARPAGRS